LAPSDAPAARKRPRNIEATLVNRHPRATRNEREGGNEESKNARGDWGEQSESVAPLVHRDESGQDQHTNDHSRQLQPERPNAHREAAHLDPEVFRLRAHPSATSRVSTCRE
jgi:hypothetical protein